MLSKEKIVEYARMSIWEHFDRLVEGGSIAIDRAGGTGHPKVPEYVYPLDYGYVEGTDGGDDSGIDIWVGQTLGLGTTALLCTFDPVKMNSEVKIVWNCNEAEIDLIDRFYSPQPQAVLVVRRPEPVPAP
ncbi:hypothetical protein [Streptomyces sp. MUM 178J]|uniref:hypothetical protein n=1 Tax=Streptomyces sp. MUM 178J TaxID=2791991 RepID=UPI001F041DD4|nr:hypothetical protein [Streptomyces sp. MUM 178J]WRQ80743.1 hypothetical protein I3F59_016025 [Streptomyces sp. MUM 178J]